MRNVCFIWSFMHGDEIDDVTYYMLCVFRARIRWSINTSCMDVIWHVTLSHLYGWISMHTYCIDTMLVHLLPLLSFLTCCLIVSLQPNLVWRSQCPTPLMATSRVVFLVLLLLWTSCVVLGILVAAMLLAKALVITRRCPAQVWATISPSVMVKSWCWIHNTSLQDKRVCFTRSFMHCHGTGEVTCMLCVFRAKRDNHLLQWRVMMLNAANSSNLSWGTFVSYDLSCMVMR